MIAIRFDGPPGPESGRFIEVERNGTSIRFGEWKQDGDDWLLELTELEEAGQFTIKALKEAGHWAQHEVDCHLEHPLCKAHLWLSQLLND